MAAVAKADQAAYYSKRYRFYSKVLVDWAGPHQITKDGKPQWPFGYSVFKRVWDETRGARPPAVDSEFSRDEFLRLLRADANRLNLKFDEPRALYKFYRDFAGFLHMQGVNEFGEATYIPTNLISKPDKVSEGSPAPRRRSDSKGGRPRIAKNVKIEMVHDRDHLKESISSISKKYFPGKASVDPNHAASARLTRARKELNLTREPCPLCAAM